jgi:hypothetical protein
MKESDIGVLLLGYNRPDSLQAVVNATVEGWSGAIRLVLDGPRNENDRLKQERILRFASGNDRLQIIWRRENLGLARNIVQAVSEGLADFEFLIVLEDDCVPSRAFFDFCTWAALRFENNASVMSASGTNHLPPAWPFGSGAYLSKYHHCWGWGTWRRAWHLMNFEMTDADIESIVASVDSGFEAGFRRYWSDRFRRTKDGQINSWAYRWLFSCWQNGGLSVTSRNALIKNIGFGVDATHTTKQKLRDHSFYRPEFQPRSGVKRRRLYELHTSYWHYATFFPRRPRPRPDPIRNC